MRILIDECLPARLKQSFISLGHDCRTVREIGLVSRKNGELLTLMEGKWDVLLTNDRNIKYQQRMAGRSVAIIVFRAVSNRLSSLLPFIPECDFALQTIEPGRIVEVGLK